DVWSLTMDSKNRIWLSTIAPEVGYIKNDFYKNVYKHSISNIHLIYPTRFCEYGGRIYFTSAYKDRQVYCISNDTMTYARPFPPNTASFIFSNDKIAESSDAGD